MSIPSLKVLIFVDTRSPTITLFRARPEGGFTVEIHSGLEAVIPLPEIDADLPLNEVYERVAFPS